MAFYLADNIVGEIQNGVLAPAYRGGIGSSFGLIIFFTNIIRLIIVAAGIFAFFNFIVAGFQFMTAGGDSKAMVKAWDRIWQSLLGLVLVVGSFALAALFGYLIFGDAGFILSPKIYGPNP